MADITRDDVLNYIEKANMVEISELVKDIEEKFGVTAAAPVAVAALAGGDSGGAAAEEQTEFDVVLTVIGNQKIQVIKAVRSLTDLGLTEAKEVVDKAPSTVLEAISKEDAEKAKATLEEVGATVELK